MRTLRWSSSVSLWSSLLEASLVQGLSLSLSSLAMSFTPSVCWIGDVTFRFFAALVRGGVAVVVDFFFATAATGVTTTSDVDSSCSAAVAVALATAGIAAACVATACSAVVVAP